MKKIIILTLFFYLLFVDPEALCVLVVSLLLIATVVTGFMVFKYGDQLGL